MVFIRIEAWAFIPISDFDLMFKQVQCLFRPRHLFHSVHLDDRDQDRMVGTSTSVYKFDSVARGYRIYKTVWTPLINETLQVMRI